MGWHLGPIWLTQLGPKCQLICPPAPYIPHVFLPLSVTNMHTVDTSRAHMKNHPRAHVTKLKLIFLEAMF